MVLYENISLSDLQAAQTAGTLKTGVVYRIISGSANFTAGGELFEVLCISPTQLANTGTGIFLNADWQVQGDYSGVAALSSIGSFLGEWNSGLTPSMYDTVNAAVSTIGPSPQLTYINITGANGGSSPVSDNTNWKLIGNGMWQSIKGTLPYNTLVGTIQVGAVITGALSAATGIMVSDDGSTLTLRGLTADFQIEAITGINPDNTTFTISSTSVTTYTFNPRQGDIVAAWGGAGSNYWGHYQKLNNTNIFVDPATDGGANYLFLPRDGNSYGYITSVVEITYNVTTDLLTRIFDSALYVDLSDVNSTGTLPKWTWGLEQNSLNSGNFVVLDIRSIDYINNNNFNECQFATPIDSNGSIAGNQFNSATFSNNFMPDSTAFFQDNILNSSNFSTNLFYHSILFTGCVLESGSQIANTLFTAGNVQGVYFAANKEILTSPGLNTVHNGEAYYSNSSNMSVLFDVAANESTGMLTIPANWNYIGIFKNSTTPANPILAFAGEIPSDHLFTVAPQAGQTFTFTTTAIALATAGQIVSGLAGATTIILNGTNGDTATFRLLANGFVQLVESIVAL